VIELVFSKVLHEAGWPYFTIMASSALLTSLLFAVGSFARKHPPPRFSDLKWVVSRALFGVSTVILSVTAVQLGSSPGDVSTLTSINIVFAALLGQLFLQERLRLVHVMAVIFSLVGAVLVARPAFLFGSSTTGSWIGSSLALLSGFMYACVYICARKSREVAVGWLSCATAGAAVPIFLMLPLTPLAQTEAMDLVLAQLLLAATLLGLVLMTTLVAIFLSTLGSALCPAAVSATIYTASSMLFGYSAQTLLFGMSPDSLTLLGAGLMFTSVVCMALARIDRSPPSTNACDGVVAAANDDASETESLASFVAAEVATMAPHAEVRQRRSDMKVPVQVLGAAAAAVA